MPHTPMRELDATTDNVEEYLEAATSLGVDPATFADVRAALDHAAALDPEEHATRTNLDGVRDRVARALADGSLTVEAARDELREATARAATDDELSHTLTRAWRTRARSADTAARAIDWTGVLLPIGLEAAAKVAELAATIPAETTDSSALRASDGTRRRWLDFGTTARRWLTVVDLFAELRRAGLLSFDPIPATEVPRLRVGDWRWSDPLVLEDVRELRASKRDETASLLAAVQAGAGPTVATPAEVHARLEHRRDLREANSGLVAQGWPIPGADVAGGPERLPRAVRGQFRPVA